MLTVFNKTIQQEEKNPAGQSRKLNTLLKKEYHPEGIIKSMNVQHGSCQQWA